MKIHTNLTSREFFTLAWGIPGVRLSATEHGSRSRARAFDLRLEADERQGRRRANSGSYGAGYDYAATWDEWGIVFARLFALDPEAECYAYHGAEDYHFKTANRFRPFGKLVEIPSEESRGASPASLARWSFPEVDNFQTHDQHRWTYTGQLDPDTWEYECKCGAVKRHVRERKAS